MLFKENEKKIINNIVNYNFGNTLGRFFISNGISEIEDDGVYFYYEDSLDENYYIFLRHSLSDEETKKMFFQKVEAINLISKLIDLKYLTVARTTKQRPYSCLWGHTANVNNNIVEFVPSGQVQEYIDRTNFTIHLSGNTPREGIKLSFINPNMIDFMEGFVYVNSELEELVHNDYKTPEEIFREKELDNAKKSLKKTNWTIVVAVASFIISALTLCVTLFGCNSCCKKTSPEKTPAYTYIMPGNYFDSETSQAQN